MSERAVVLLSGGVDSATCLALALEEDLDVRTLGFRYGQRNHHEVEAACTIAERAGVAHRTVEIDLGSLGGSALTDPAVEVPTGPVDASGIPSTYVPARNTIFLAHAMAVAEVSGARQVFIGVNAVDYSGYPDCRPEYLAAFEEMANLATAAWVGAPADRRFRVRAPLVSMSKAEIIRLGTSLGVDYSLTTSCYDPSPDGASCAVCAACRIRARGFAQAGVADPTRYVGATRP